jgi:hypothetical protein
MKTIVRSDGTIARVRIQSGRIIIRIIHPSCGPYYFSRKYNDERYDVAVDDLLSTLYEYKATPGSFRNKQQYDTWTCRSDWKKK